MLRLGQNANFGDNNYPHADVRHVSLTSQARKLGTYVVGTTGTGKSTFLLNLIYQDMRNGDGLCVLDPHGDFTLDILHRVPDDRLDDVILFDPSDLDYPLGLNPLDCNKDSAHERDLVVTTLMDTLYKLFAYSWGPRMEDLLRHSLHSILFNEGMTLFHLLLVLIDYRCRQGLTEQARLHDPVFKAYWELQFPESKFRDGLEQQPREQVDLITSSLNKIGRFLVNPIIRNIICQTKSAFNFREIMDEGKILLVNLSKGSTGADNSHFLGAVIINQIYIAALSRADKPERQRQAFHLYVDEYQNFATKTFPELQSEARKYGIDTTVAHQYRDQLDDQNKGSTLNVANLVTLRVSGKDAIELAVQYEAQPSTTLPKFQAQYELFEGLGWYQRKVENEVLYDKVDPQTQAYSDAHLEIANLMAQLPNYQAFCRVLDDSPTPRHFRQFRIDLYGKGEEKIDPEEAYEKVLHVRRQSRELVENSPDEIRKKLQSLLDDCTGGGVEIIKF